MHFLHSSCERSTLVSISLPLSLSLSQDGICFGRHITSFDYPQVEKESHYLPPVPGKG